MMGDSFEIVSCDERGYMIKCRFHGETIWLIYTNKGYGRGGEMHPIKQYVSIISGKMLFKMMFGEEEIERRLISGQNISIPENIPHVAMALEDSIAVEWHDGELPPFEQKIIYKPYRKLIRRKKK